MMSFPSKLYNLNSILRLEMIKFGLVWYVIQKIHAKKLGESGQAFWAKACFTGLVLNWFVFSSKSMFLDCSSLPIFQVVSNQVSGSDHG